MPAPHLTISQITTTPLSLEQELALATRHGHALELAEKKLPSAPQAASAALQRIRDSGVEVVSLQPATLSPFPTTSQPTPADRSMRIAALKASIERFAPLWPGLPLVTNTGALGGDENTVWDGCVEAYRDLAVHAERHGMRLALEALGPSLMNRNSILYTFGQAVEMVEAVDHPAFGLCLDLYNSWQDPRLLDALRDAGDRLWLVQLADWRRPRSLHDRRGLGEGRIPLAAMLDRIADTGYQGAYVLEIFSEQVADSYWANPESIERVIANSSGWFTRWAEHRRSEDCGQVSP